MRRCLPLALLVSLCCSAPASALRFHHCGKAQCGTVVVPLDYGDPTGPAAQIAVARIRAQQPNRRIGTLFFNYGGPGAGAVDSLTETGGRLFKAYRKRFDLIAVDPRGTGRSRPTVDCNVNQTKLGVYHKPFLTAKTFDEARDVGLARAYADRCARLNAQIAPHLSTANVARDFDAVRTALGEDKITYFGFSYGTFLGATYAALFGDHVRAMVLDGALGPNDYVNDPMKDLREQTDGFENALTRYLDACGRHRRQCGWIGRTKPLAAYDYLIQRANAHPIRARGTNRPVDGDDINTAVSSDLYVKQFWPEITAALGEAEGGNASTLRALADSSYGRRRNGTYSPSLDRYFAIGASEQQYPRDLQPYFDAGATANFDDPHFYFNRGYAELNYGVYAPRDEDAFLGPFTLPTTTPTPLVVGTTFDPATPYIQAQAMTAELGNARLLTMKGDGHTAYGGNSPCIDRTIDAYVLRLALPPEGKTCRQQVPFAPRPEKQAKASASIASVAPAAPVHVGPRGPLAPPALARLGFR